MLSGGQFRDDATTKRRPDYPPELRQNGDSGIFFPTTREAHRSLIEESSTPDLLLQLRAKPPQLLASHLLTKLAR